MSYASTATLIMEVVDAAARCRCVPGRFSKVAWLAGRPRSPAGLGVDDRRTHRRGGRAVRDERGTREPTAAGALRRLGEVSRRTRLGCRLTNPDLVFALPRHNTAFVLRQEAHRTPWRDGLTSLRLYLRPLSQANRSPTEEPTHFASFLSGPTISLRFTGVENENTTQPTRLLTPRKEIQP